MNNPFQKKPFIIGMVHFGALTGQPSPAKQELILKHAQTDLNALLEGGVDGVMFENMYDAPHTEALEQERADLFHKLLVTLTKDLKIPFGLSILWNDFQTAFRLAVETNASWIRVPVFVDSVQTVYGVFHADPDSIIQARKEAHAEDVLILADIQVKHARMLHPRPIEASAKAAEESGADGIIITGTWTGEAAALEDVKNASQATTLPVFIGSGITAENIKTYVPFITGAIVGTTLKASPARPIEEVRLRTSEEDRVDAARVRNIIRVSRHL